MKLKLKENKTYQGKVLLAGEEAPAEWKDKPFVEVIDSVPEEKKEVRTVIGKRKKKSD